MIDETAPTFSDEGTLCITRDDLKSVPAEDVRRLALFMGLGDWVKEAPIKEVIRQIIIKLRIRR